MERLQRLDSGRPLRAAMAEAGVSIPALARATKLVDPEGRGVSQSLIGFLCSTGRSQRETCSRRSAQLIAEARNTPVEKLFTSYSAQSINPPASSTATGDRSEPDGNPAAR